MLVLLLIAIAFQYNIDMDMISCSGISAGAFFSVQLEMAYSDTFMGGAAVAGGPYYCAQGQMTMALTQCMNFPSMVSIDTLISKLQAYESTGKVDSTKNIANHSIYIYAGTKDTTVKPEASKKLYEMYQKLNVPSENIIYKNDIASEHAFITDDYGNSCAFGGSPWINNCNYDQAKAIFEHFYGDLKDKTEPVSSNIIEFDQSKYGATSMDSKGYIYVPSECKDGAKCKLHFAFHGCQQYYGKIGDVFIKNAGYNRWAESNNIIVVYPQTTSQMLSNPNGCYDWWGYSGSDYATKDGNQMKMMYDIISDLK